jgi:hypothetical protein
VVLVPLIDRVVEDPDTRMTAVDDVARRWRRLAQADRERYTETSGPPGWTGVMAFAEEFFQTMDNQATAELGDMLEGTVRRHPVDGQPYEPLEAARIEHWRNHLDRVSAAEPDQG